MSEERLKEIEVKVAAVVNTDIQYPELQDKYTNWPDYEQDMLFWGYKSPQIAAEEVSVLLGDKKDAGILDVCAGTGMTGKAMYDAGYTNIEALDGNLDMMERAKEKKAYKAYHQAYLGKPIDMPDNSYDMITLFGALCDGHVNPDCFSCFREFCRIIKPGGYFIGGIVTTCLKEGYKQKIEEAYQALVTEGLWEQVANKVVTIDTYGEQIWIFRVK